MKTFKSAQTTATIMVGGSITTAAEAVLADWDNGLLEGTVKANSVVLPNAAVEVIQLVDTVETILGITFTGADGKYKVSVPVVALATYKINVYAPIA